MRQPAISKDKLGYAVGVTWRATSAATRSTSTDQLIKGLRDAMAGDKLQMSEREVRKTMNQFQNDLRIRMVATRGAVGARWRAARSSSPRTRRSRTSTCCPAACSTVHQAGTGPKPVDTDTVVVNYRGMSLDGLEIDATDAGAPASFKGDPGGRGLEAGAAPDAGGPKGRWIPGLLAYGERGVGSALGPNETLVFDVELVAIK